MNFQRAKPFMAMVFMQSLYAAMSIVGKMALNAEMNPRVFVTYRMAVASALITPLALVLERNSRPKMTCKIMFQIAFLSLFEPVVEQNLFFSGMKLTTATFTSAMTNAIPAITFIMACIFKLEKVEVKRRHSQAKVVGTIVAIGGAMLMTFVKGNVIELPWTRNSKGSLGIAIQKHEDITRGAIMLVASCFSWSCYIILQANIVAQYQAGLTLTSLMCIIAMLEAGVIGLIWERQNTSLWKIKADVKLVASIFGGLVSCLSYYVSGWASKARGPVFVSAFNPLNMVLVAIISTFIFLEKMYLGWVIGSFIIVSGIYLVLWGKSKDERQKKLDEQREQTNESVAEQEAQERGQTNGSVAEQEA